MLTNDALVAFLATTDLDRARVFFTDTIGLALVHQDGFACVFDAHGTPLRVSLVEELHPAPYTVLGWVVDDAAATVRDLGARGARFERFDGMAQDDLGIWTTPGGDFVAWFKDPDANVLSVTQHARG